MNRKIVILGSTGSIGTQTLDVVDELHSIQVEGLTAYSNIELLIQQIKKYHPKKVAVMDPQAYHTLFELYQQTDTTILLGMEGIIEVATMDGVDTVVNALVGNIGLVPTVEAIQHGKNIALANKETLVTAGSLIMQMVKAQNVHLYPIDSEHSAIFQCLQGNHPSQVRKIIITASGGPFRTKTAEELATVTVENALKHPNWVMGKKITIDSATLMNKGLEVIEAKWLFGLDSSQIEVLVHPQSVIHSMVEYEDGAVMAQLGEPDMRVPISYALTYPERATLPFPKMDFLKYPALTFEKPKMDLFPCLSLAYRALEQGGDLCAVLNAANEVAVDLFLKEKIKFMDIPRLIEQAMNAYTVKTIQNIDDVLKADVWARDFISNHCEV